MQDEVTLTEIDKFMLDEIQSIPNQPSMEVLRQEVSKLSDELNRLKEDSYISKLSSMRNMDKMLEDVIIKM